MRLEDLNADQRELVGLDFGDAIEKEAAEKVAMVQEMYGHGHNNLAVEMADGYDELCKQAAEEAAEEEEKEEAAAKEEDEKSDEEKTASASLESTAAELGAFIERGVFDGLQKLGSDRHGDPAHYLLPYMQEKVAEAGAQAALEKFAGVTELARNVYRGARGQAKRMKKDTGDRLSQAAYRAKNTSAKEVAEAAKAKATGAYNKGKGAVGGMFGGTGAGAGAGISDAASAAKDKAKGMYQRSDLKAAITGKGKPGVGASGLDANERARALGRAGAKGAVGAAGLGGLYGASKLVGGKSDK